MKYNKSMFYLFCIIVISILIKLLFFSGFIGDSMWYTNIAATISKGGEVRLPIGRGRIGLLFPTSIFLSLFVIIVFSATFLPFLASLGSIIVIYFLGKDLFDKRTGLWAAFLYIFFPLYTIYSTALHPDIPVSFLTGISFLIFLKGKRTNQKNQLFFIPLA